MGRSPCYVEVVDSVSRIFFSEKIIKEGESINSLPTHLELNLIVILKKKYFQF